MANPEHLAKLKEGVEAWNQWRRENPDVTPRLEEVNLAGIDLCNADLYKADLSLTDLTAADANGANLKEAELLKSNLFEADCIRTNFSGANLSEANLFNADLGAANLTGTDLFRANLSDANLTGADLTGADLRHASLIGTNFGNANLTGCHVFGISAWNLHVEGAIQSNLVITQRDEPAIQVDSLEVAQFIHLLLNNRKIRDVIDEITSKVVLILGRFSKERKVVLEAIRDELRRRGFLPVLFDFEKPDSKDLTGTVTTLANMARFVIADLTDPSSVPHELAMIVPGTVVPVQTILLDGQHGYAMFADLKRRYHWVLEPFRYESQDSLLQHLEDGVIRPAEVKAAELVRR